MIRGRSQGTPVVDLADEMAEHGLGDLKIGDDPFPHRPNGHDISGRPAQHQLGLLSDGQDLVVAFGVFADGDDGWLA